MAVRVRAIALAIGASVLAVARGAVVDASPWGPAPVLSANFASGVLDNRITCSGGANGTRINASGAIEAASSPRFDYDPVTLVPKGILREETRANKMLQSSDFTVAPWAATVTGSSTRTNEVRADLGFPVGVITATSANGGIRQPISGLTSGQPHALTYYVESTATSVMVVLENGTASYGQPCSVIVNPSTGAAGAPTGFTAVGSTPYRTGYLYTILLPVAAGTLAANIEWRITNSGDVLRLGRPQFEQGGSATSYIPTAGAAVTRTADSILITGANLASIYSSAAGTVIVEAEQPTIFAQSRTAVGLWLDAGNRIGIYRQSAGAINGWYNAPLASGQNAVAATFWKAALAWSGSALALSAKGSAVVTATYANSMAFTTLAIGDNGSDTEGFNGHIRTVTIYPKRLSDAQLQAMTA